MITINKNALATGAVIAVAVLVSSAPAFAAATTGGDNNFSTIGRNIIESISQLPNLLSGVAYMFGILLGVLGILKIKDHVENPGQTPLKDGAIRLAAGGGLFALPIVYEAMTNTIGDGGPTTAATLSAVTFGSGTTGTGN